MNLKLLKENARINFKKKYGESIVVALIMSLALPGTTIDEETIKSFSTGISEETLALFGITFLVTSIAAFAFEILVKPIFTVGGNRFFLKLRRNIPTGINETMGNFKDGNYKNIVKTTFFVSLEIMLYSLFLIFPGIIAAFNNFLVDYILAVRPDVDYTTSMAMSKNLMKGHRFEAFKLIFSFIGWDLLSLCTFGILSIVYVSPYRQAALVEFYSYIRSEGLRKGLITVADLPDYEAQEQNPFYPQFNQEFQQPGMQNPNPYQQNPYQQNPYQQNVYQDNPYRQDLNND
ncbi:MAG: DUF975 family protein [Clostridia bacterium]|nr:DUF975 family protein [Clostridia bacterium]